VSDDSSVVFTLDEQKKLVAHEIQIGALLGDRVEIVSGVSADMEIVTDARGLREGQTVTTQ
jgi:multidrug efflux pump subunit AcrA (membrane-fusion protein)